MKATKFSAPQQIQIINPSDLDILQAKVIAEDSAELNTAVMIHEVNVFVMLL